VTSPLTTLKNYLRARGGGDVYETTFVERYLLPVLYPAALTRELQFMLAAAVFAVNLAIYALVVARLRHRVLDAFRRLLATRRR